MTARAPRATLPLVINPSPFGFTAHTNAARYYRVWWTCALAGTD
ncbi:MAG TPA: hypothetical protein VEZ48_07545 [Sphingomonadaceae bacterium]|nr:hypothetical protein [Sphingomonadaceae bacterium]